MKAPMQRPPETFRASRLAAGVFGVAICMMAASAAFAQSSQAQNLADKVDRLQRELQTLQRAVYRGEKPPEPDAVPAQGQLTPGHAARIEVRLSQFESELRSLTGQIENMSFAVDQVTARLDKLVADVDRRLQQLEAGGQFGQAAPAQAQPDVGAGSSSTVGTIGTIPQSDLQAAQSQTAAFSPSSYELPGDTPEAKYGYAFSLLRQANYGEAELALKAFVQQFGSDPLAGNAQYWLGETYYVQGDYQQAAVAFAEAYQNYPNSEKAPDNLLKLGKALAALGSREDACGTHAELLRRYPNAASTIRQHATQELQRLDCP